LKTTPQNNPELITLEQAPTLAALFRERVRRSAGRKAYVQYDSAADQWREHSWEETARQVARWQQAMRDSGLKAGERVMIMCHNAWEWVICDQATLGLGLVLVPIFMNDRAENIAWIANDCQASLLVIEGEEQWQALESVRHRVVCLQIRNPYKLMWHRFYEFSVGRLKQHSLICPRWNPHR